MTTTTSVPVETGESDATYDLIFVLQQALEDCYRYAQFAQDAREAGDEELAGVFDELVQQDRDLARKLRALLKARI
jgi:ferritin-like metal-binding protein YciE